MMSDFFCLLNYFVIFYPVDEVEEEPYAALSNVQTPKNFRVCTMSCTSASFCPSVFHPEVSLSHVSK